MTMNWNSTERQLAYNFFNRVINAILLDEVKALRKTFSKWISITNEIKKTSSEIQMRYNLINILTNSTRGKRTTLEKEEIRKYITLFLHCIPKTISFSEMDTLCNEIDWNPLIGRSIIFLQGDFGNVYYLIAKGSVGLYLEPSKDREMIIAREFGNLRSQPYLGSNEDLNKLGNNIINLSQGSGFGEYAILATTNKIRSCAAVSLDDECMLLVVHADTYNVVLKQHHYRQKQLSSATSLLQELPLLKHQNYSTIAAIAYTLRSQTYSNKTIMIRSGDIINNLLLISNGDIKVYASNTNNDEVDNKNITQHEKNIHKRLPKLAISVWSRGKIIGESEILKGLRHFELNYECCSSTCEIFEIPSTVFKDNIKNDINSAIVYKTLKETHQEKDELLTSRANRAFTTMKNIMINTDREFKTKNDLKNALPILINPPTNNIPATLEYNAVVLNGSGSYGKHIKNSFNTSFTSSSGGSNGDVVVTRRASFSIQSLNNDINADIKNNIKSNQLSQSEATSYHRSNNNNNSVNISSPIIISSTTVSSTSSPTKPSNSTTPITKTPSPRKTSFNLSSN